VSGEVVGEAYVRCEPHPRREGGEVGQDRFTGAVTYYNTAALPPR
jgi:hypothetical protein